MDHRSFNFAIRHTVSRSLKMLGYNNMEKERAVKTNSVSEITKLKNVSLILPHKSLHRKPEEKFM